jgi:hypothetical protein
LLFLVIYNYKAGDNREEEEGGGGGKEVLTLLERLIRTVIELVKNDKWVGTYWL